MWGQIIGLLGSLLGGGQQQERDPMADYQARMRMGMGQTPNYPEPQAGGMGGAQQPQGGMFNQGFGVDRQKWEMMQMLARRLGGGGGGGGGMGGGY